MASLPNRNILDGSANPSTSTFQSSMGSLRDFLSGLFGDDGTIATARTTLSAAKSGINNDISQMTGLGSGVLNIGSGQFYKDAAGKVGFGTSSPSSNVTIRMSHAVASATACTGGFLIHDEVNGVPVHLNAGVAYDGGLQHSWIQSNSSGGAQALALNPSGGNIGIGVKYPSYQLQLSTDSAAKPATSTWTIPSDMRLKNKLADLRPERCAEIVEEAEVFYGEYKDGVYAEGQVNDTKQLMFSAQSVQKVFKQAVRETSITYAKKEEDGIEEYQEQAFELVTTTVKEIQIINGVPTQVERVVESKVMLFDTVAVIDLTGNIVMVDDKPLTHQVPRMVTKIRPKFKQQVLEDALSLDKDQLYMANFGATKYVLNQIVELKARIVQLESLK